MKQLITFFGTMFFLSCASTKLIPLKGSYPIPPIVASSDKSFEKVWEKAIDYFAENGIPIKIIDKSSGIIVSDKTKLTWSFEDKTGKLVKASVDVALDKIAIPMNDSWWVPQTVTGEWNIRIKPTGSGTSINVNLYNIQALYQPGYYSSSRIPMAPITITGRTTGNFESRLENAIK